MTDKLDFNLSNLFVIHKLKQVCQAVDSIKQNYATYRKKVDRMEAKIIDMCTDLSLHEKPKKYLKGWEAIKAYSEGKKIRLKNSTYAFLILEDIISIKSLVENDWEIVE